MYNSHGYRTNHKYKMANNEMISKINRPNYLQAYCEPATTNRSNLTQYYQSNAQQSTVLILVC